MSEDEKTPEEIYAAEVEKAKLLGWVPKEEYKGDPEKWRDAPEFNEFGERLNPILRENNKRLEAQLKEREREIQEIRVAVAKMAKAHAEKEKEVYAQAIADLRAERKEALENGDYDKAEEVTERIEVTKAAQVNPIVVDQPTVVEKEIQVQYESWAKENLWALETSSEFDPELEAYARFVGNEIVKKQGKATIEEFRPFLDKVTAKVKERFPEKFGNTLRRAPVSVESDTGAGDVSSTGNHSYAKLPAEAKRECDLMLKNKIIPSKEFYIKHYQWSK